MLRTYGSSKQSKTAPINVNWLSGIDLNTEKADENPLRNNETLRLVEDRALFDITDNVLNSRHANVNCDHDMNDTSKINQGKRRNGKFKNQPIEKKSKLNESEQLKEIINSGKEHEREYLLKSLQDYRSKHYEKGVYHVLAPKPSVTFTIDDIHRFVHWLKRLGFTETFCNNTYFELKGYEKVNSIVLL